MWPAPHNQAAQHRRKSARCLLRAQMECSNWKEKEMKPPTFWRGFIFSDLKGWFCAILSVGVFLAILQLLK